MTPQFFRAFDGDVADLGQGEKILRASEERFRLLTEAIPAVFWMVEPREPILWYVSPAAEKIYGYSAAELCKNPRLAAELVHPEDQPRVLPILLHFRKAYDVEYRIVRPDGRVRWIRSRSVPVLDESGELIRLTGFSEDITDRRANEERLRYSEATLAEAQRIAELGSWDLQFTDPENLNEGVLHWSDQVFRIFGYEPGAVEVTNDNFFHSVHPEDREKVARAVREAITEHKPYSIVHRVVRPDGSERIVHEQSRVSYDETSRRPLRMVGTVQDITERERIKRALEVSERKFREVFDSSLDTITISSFATGVFLDANREFEKLSGYSREEILGKTAGQITIWPSRETLKDVRRILGDDGIVRNYTVELRRKDGGTVWVLYSAMRMDLDGEHCVVSFVRDITDRKLAEEELTRAKDAALQASRLKSAFLANMSHEIRTPLNVILGFNAFVKENLAEVGDHSQDEYFATIGRSGQRLLSTINGMLDLSRIETDVFDVRPTLVDVPALIRQQLKEFERLAKTKGITLDSRIEVEKGVVLFDEYCLSQTLLNLLDNAIKFTAEGGVCVRLSQGPDQCLVLEVVDTGVGIDAAFLPHLFEPFSQEEIGYARPFEGAGLGTALAKNYLEMNGASIIVESKKGKGSTFRIFLPVRSA